MELREFVEIALRDIFSGTKDAQKHILYGEIIPNKDGKSGEADIEFEIAVTAEENKLIVVMPPAPPAPHLSKVKFKIPVRFPKKRGGFLSHLIEYYCIKRRHKKEQLVPVESQPQLSSSTAAANVNTDSPPPSEEKRTKQPPRTLP